MAIFRRKAARNLSDMPPKITYEELLSFIECDKKDDINLRETAKKLNLRIKYKSLEPEVSFYLRKDPSTGEWYAIINLDHSKGRKKFSLALIIATYCLFSDHQPSFARYNFFHEIEKYEEMVNEFALKLIISNTKFRNTVKKTKKTIEIAKILKIPEMVVRHKAKSMGYKGHGV